MKKFIQNTIYFIKETDNLLMLFSVLASVFGMVMVYSATRCDLSDGEKISSDVVTMIAAVAIGIVLALLISLIDFDAFGRFWFIIGAFGVLLMVIVLIFGVAPASRPDARCWLDFKLFYFQPSELVKICFIITFATHLNRVKETLNKFKTVMLLLVHMAIPVLLILLSGDAGSAVVFVLIAAVMLFVAGLNWKYILGGFVLACAAVPLLWLKMSSFQKERFIVIVNPDAYPDTAYQQTTGLTAIGSGGFTGEGLFKGVYTQAGTVPESQNDFVFTVIGEELGFIGCVLAIVLLIAIVFRIINDGKKSDTFNGALMCYGVASVIAIQSVINIAMCLRLGPVIGITLPFFSAGGSSSLCLYIGLGVVLSIYRSTHNRKPVDYRVGSIVSPFN